MILCIWLYQYYTHSFYVKMGVFLPIMLKKWGFFCDFIPVMGKNFPILSIFLGFILVSGVGLGVFTVVFLSFWVKFLPFDVLQISVFFGLFFNALPNYWI